MPEAKNILITGASGLLGTELTRILLEQGRTVAHLGRSRSKDSKIKSFVWDVRKNQIDSQALTNADTIIHLAGASVGEGRWTPERKKEILDSRVDSTRLLLETLKKSDHQVRTFISASAIGYYGFDDEEKVYREDDSAGQDFLAEVTRQWEEEVDKISSPGIRVVKMRIGIVFSEKGGALKQMATPVKFFVGSPLGSGRQPVSWIHIDDTCGIIVKAIDDEKMTGPYNVVAPSPSDNRTITKSIARALHRPLIAPSVPGFALKLILGQMAEIVLTGSKVSAEKILKAGYQFKFTDLDKAVQDLLGKK